MFRDRDINVKEFCNFQEIISLRFSVSFDQKSSIFYFFLHFLECLLKILFAFL